LTAPEVKGHGNTDGDGEQNGTTDDDQDNPNGGQTSVVTPQASVMLITAASSIGSSTVSMGSGSGSVVLARGNAVVSTRLISPEVVRSQGIRCNRDVPGSVGKGQIRVDVVDGLVVIKEQVAGVAREVTGISEKSGSIDLQVLGSNSDRKGTVDNHIVVVVKSRVNGTSNIGRRHESGQLRAVASESTIGTGFNAAGVSDLESISCNVIVEFDEPHSRSRTCQVEASSVIVRSTLLSPVGICPKIEIKNFHHTVG